MNYSYWEQKYLLADIDYLIVGMGLVGLQTAINIKEKDPMAKVVAIDRHSWSLGASTRNAGFACFANVSEILNDLQHDSPSNVYGTIRKRYNGLQKIRTKFGDQAIGYTERGSCEIFNKQNKEQLASCIDSLQGVNTILERELGLERVFTYNSNNSLPGTYGAIYNDYEGQLNTGKLYDTIYSYAQKIGVKLYGGIEVVSWERSKSISVQTTHSHTLTTKYMILCTNAFASQMVDADVMPCRGQVVLSEQVENLPCEGLFMYDQGYYYWRDIDNRILLGGARNIDTSVETSYTLESNDQIIDELRRFMTDQIFGREVAIDYQWSGIMGMGKTYSKTPIVKEVEPNIYLAVRLGGMGVALSANVADEVVRLIHKS